jgi:hypothetical protein
MTVTISGATGIATPLGSASAPADSNTTNSNTGLYFPTGTTAAIATNGTLALSIDTSQNITGAAAVSDVAGNLRTIVQNSQTTGYTLVATDNGKFINITTGGVTVPSSIFSAGQNVVVYNNSTSAQTITQGSGVTLTLAGTTSTGNRTLSANGIGTIICTGSNAFLITGTGVS